jgi:hypothetical protein
LSTTTIRTFSSSSSEEENRDNTKPHYVPTQPMVWDEYFSKNDNRERMTKEAFLRAIGL